VTVKVGFVFPCQFALSLRLPSELSHDVKGYSEKMQLDSYIYDIWEGSWTTSYQLAYDSATAWTKILRFQADRNERAGSKWPGQNSINVSCITEYGSAPLKTFSTHL
jgi:hypothetical protein